MTRLICETLELKINPDGSTIAIPCGKPAIVQFKDPLCPCCGDCYEEAFFKGNVKDLGGISGIPWMYSQI